MQRLTRRSPARGELPIQGAFELRLRHLRTPFQSSFLCLVVELVVRAAFRSRVRAKAAAPTGRDVLRRRTALRLRLSRSGSFLIHRPRRDLLREVFGSTVLLQALLDVLVLTLALRTPRLLRHVAPPSSGGVLSRSHTHPGSAMNACRQTNGRLGGNGELQVQADERAVEAEHPSYAMPQVNFHEPRSRRYRSSPPPTHPTGPRSSQA